MAQSQKNKTLIITRRTQNNPLQILIKPHAQWNFSKTNMDTLYRLLVYVSAGECGDRRVPALMTCAVTSRKNAMDREVHRTVL